jgi:hypothetical protein
MSRIDLPPLSTFRVPIVSTLKLFTAKAAKERKGKQSTGLVIKVTNLVIASEFALALNSLASLRVLGVLGGEKLFLGS